MKLEAENYHIPVFYALRAHLGSAHSDNGKAAARKKLVMS